MEVIDIGLSDLEPVSFNLEENDASQSKGAEPPSVNFGPGVELLMNDKKISANSSTKVDIEDLNNLENELNDLTKNVETSESSEPSSTLGGISSFLNFGRSNEKRKNQLVIYTNLHLI